MGDPRWLARRVVAIAVVAAVLSACVGQDASDSKLAVAQTTPLSEVTPAADPRAIEGPSTAVLADRTITPVAENPQQSLPAEVVSHDRGGDVTVTVTDTERVVALDLSGSLSATVWGLGMSESLVGRDVSSGFPGAEDLPIVTTSGHSVNAEAILDVNPTLVITDGSIGPRDVVEQLRSAGVTVVFLNNDPSFEGAQQQARDVAAVLGVPEAGELLADQIAAQVQQVHSIIDSWVPAGASDRVSVAFLYLRGSSGIYYLLGEDSGATDLIESLGAVDVASREGWSDSQPLSDEAIVAANPDVFLVMTDGIDSVGGVDKLLADKPSLALTEAGKKRRFIDMADADVLSYGPRSAAVLEALARALYAPDAT